MATVATHARSAQSHQQTSTDSNNELNPQTDHYIGIDIGTGSARACVIDGKGTSLGWRQKTLAYGNPSMASM